MTGIIITTIICITAIILRKLNRHYDELAYIEYAERKQKWDELSKKLNNIRNKQ